MYIAVSQQFIDCVTSQVSSSLAVSRPIDPTHFHNSICFVGCDLLVYTVVYLACVLCGKHLWERSAGLMQQAVRRMLEWCMKCIEIIYQSQTYVCGQWCAAVCCRIREVLGRSPWLLAVRCQARVYGTKNHVCWGSPSGQNVSTFLSVCVQSPDLRYRQIPVCIHCHLAQIDSCLCTVTWHRAQIDSSVCTIQPGLEQRQRTTQRNRVCKIKKKKDDQCYHSYLVTL